MENYLITVERLIETVARAFYTDPVVVVLDALIAEKFIIEEELAPRLKMSGKDIRKITTQLEAEMLIKTENVYIDDNRSFIKCYYIDYQSFVDVIRYRVHLMQLMLVREERTELNEVFYQCPTCKAKYSSLQAQRLISGDFKFICSNCCPIENFRVSPSELYYRLVEVDNRGKLDNLQLLDKKMEEQMSTHPQYHRGLFDLLHQLRDAQLSNNKPSDNVKKGLNTSKVADQEVKEEIERNWEYAKGKYGTSLIKKRTQTMLDAQINERKNTGFEIRIESEVDSKSMQVPISESFGIIIKDTDEQDKKRIKTENIVIETEAEQKKEENKDVQQDVADDDMDDDVDWEDADDDET